MKTNKIGHKVRSGHRVLILLTGISLIIIPIIAAIFGFICHSTADPVSGVKLFALIALLVSGALGGIINGKLSGNGGFPICAAATVTASIVIMLVGVVINRGVTSAALMNILCYILTSLFFAFFLGRKKRARRKTRHK